MVNRVQRLKILLVGSALCAALTACGPRYVTAESLSGQAHAGSYGGVYAQGGASQYNYSQDNYSQETYAQAYTQQKSRYGYQAGLRAPCDEVQTPCGFMRVVPVYPVYQYVTPAEPEPVVEVPTISTPEPEPVVIYEPEPEPVYTPSIQHWPDPETEVPSWKPLRK